MSEFLTPQQLADRYSISLRTIEGWRAKGKGPAGHKLGGLLRYRLADVERWESEQRDADPEPPAAVILRPRRGRPPGRRRAS